MSQAYSPGGMPGAPIEGDPGTLDLPWYGIGFGDAIKRFFQKYARFDGRASRGEFWWVVLAGVLLYLAMGIIANVVIGGENLQPLVNEIAAGQVPNIPSNIGVMYGIFALIDLALLIPWIAVSVRRLHDANLSGFYFLLSLLCCFGTIVVLILCVQSSNPVGARFDRRG